jgi:poly(A) polymerase Pap1
MILLHDTDHYRDSTMHKYHMHNTTTFCFRLVISYKHKHDFIVKPTESLNYTLYIWRGRERPKNRTHKVSCLLPESMILA